MSSTPKEPQQVIFDTQKSLISNFLKKKGLTDDEKAYLENILRLIESAKTQYKAIKGYETAIKRYEILKSRSIFEPELKSNLEKMKPGLEKSKQLIREIEENLNTRFKGLKDNVPIIVNFSSEEYKAIDKISKSLENALQMLQDSFKKISKPIPASKIPQLTAYGYNPKPTGRLSEQVTEKSPPKTPAPKTSAPKGEKPRWQP